MRSLKSNEAELIQNILHVLLHGARTAIEDGGDLVVAFACRDPSDHFAFSRCQRMKRVGID